MLFQSYIGARGPQTEGVSPPCLCFVGGWTYSNHPREFREFTERKEEEMLITKWKALQLPVFRWLSHDCPYFGGRGNKKKSWGSGNLERLRDWLRKVIASQEWWWEQAGDEQGDPGDWLPHAALFFYTLSLRLQSTEEQKVKSKERTMNKEGKRLSRERLSRWENWLGSSGPHPPQCCQITFFFSLVKWKV